MVYIVTIFCSNLVTERVQRISPCADASEVRLFEVQCRDNNVIIMNRVEETV
jgi:hypothetical protein